MRFRAVVTAATVAAFSVAATSAAFAACTKLSFTVNDYGKDGPTKDAKNLLDKYAQKWTSERGIKKFSVGAKDVSCELFLNFIVFDEHTCTATANVCWEGSTPGAVKDAGVEATPFLNKAATTKAAGAKAKATTAPGDASAPVTSTGSIKPAAPAAPKAVPAAPAKSPASTAAPAATPISAPSTAAASVMPAGPAEVSTPSVPAQNAGAN